MRKKERERERKNREGWGTVLDLFIQAFVRAMYGAARRHGRKSDFAWNFLISKGPEKKSNAAIARYERANEIVALYKGARTSATLLARLPISRSVVSLSPGIRETGRRPVN